MIHPYTYISFYNFHYKYFLFFYRPWSNITVLVKKVLNKKNALQYFGKEIKINSATKIMSRKQKKSGPSQWSYKIINVLIFLGVEGLNLYTVNEHRIFLFFFYSVQLDREKV